MKRLVTRRGLIGGAAAATAVTASAAVTAGCGPRRAPSAAPAFDPTSWASVKAQFPLDPNTANFAAFVFASHIPAVRAAIDDVAGKLDRDPVGLLRDEDRYERAVDGAARAYLGGDAGAIAYTDSTTAGLGLLYSGLKLAPGEEILTTEHDFYATHESLRLLAARTGVTIRKTRLYQDPAKATEDEILSSLGAALSPRVAVVALTWVHSGTGVRLPVAAMADLIRSRTNALVCLDAVHGFGARKEKPTDLKVDFFASGGHKWLFGPRGTGVLWGSPAGWARYTPVIPTFDRNTIGSWITGQQFPATPGALATPGGYHTFEYRWALAAAFEFHQRIGADRVAERTEKLATKLKDGIAEMPNVALSTPRSPALSAGIVCCDVRGLRPGDAVAALRSHNVTASVTPYATELLRFGTSIATDEADVDRALAALRALS
jgi:selenocysteine lyase/cysteine desulfurase